MVLKAVTEGLRRGPKQTRKFGTEIFSRQCSCVIGRDAGVAVGVARSRGHRRGPSRSKSSPAARRRRPDVRREPTRAASEPEADKGLGERRPSPLEARARRLQTGRPPTPRPEDLGVSGGSQPTAAAPDGPSPPLGPPAESMRSGPATAHPRRAGVPGRGAALGGGARQDPKGRLAWVEPSGKRAPRGRGGDGGGPGTRAPIKDE